MNIERMLVSKVVTEGDITPALDIKIAPDWFLDPDEKQVWAYVRRYYTEYGETPTEAVLRKSFPDYEVLAVSEPLQFVVDEMATARKRAILEVGLSEVVSLVEDDVEAALDALQKTLTQTHSEVSQLRDVDLVTSFQRRIERYDEIQEFGGKLLGVPTGIPMLDSKTAGLRPEQLVTLTGLPKAGKSALLLHFAKSAHEHGATVLFVGFEMSNEEQAARYDAMLAGIDHLHLIRGGLTRDDRKKLERTLTKRKHMQPFVLSADASSSTNVAAIGAKIEQYRPDIVFVDGVYMMEADSGEDDERKKLTEITRSFKRLAQRTKLPVVISTQSLEWKTSRSKGLSTSSLGYSSSFVQDSDIVIGVETPDPDEEPDVKRIKMLASRSTALGSALLHWDWSTGTVTELAGEDEDDDTLVDPEVI